MDNNSILQSVKKMLGIAETYTHFDSDLIMHINTIFSVLTQLGVGPKDGFRIEDESAEWTDFLSEKDLQVLEAIKSYMYLRVRLLFDPPQSGIVTEAINKQLSEFEWRLNVAAEEAKEVTT